MHSRNDGNMTQTGISHRFCQLVRHIRLAADEHCLKQSAVISAEKLLRRIADVSSDCKSRSFHTLAGDSELFGSFGVGSDKNILPCKIFCIVKASALRVHRACQRHSRRGIFARLKLRAFFNADAELKFSVRRVGTCRKCSVRRRFEHKQSERFNSSVTAARKVCAAPVGSVIACNSQKHGGKCKQNRKHSLFADKAGIPGG